MKPYLNIDPGDPRFKDDLDEELFQGGYNPEVPLSVSDDYRPYPEMRTPYRARAARTTVAKRLRDRKDGRAGLGAV